MRRLPLISVGVLALTLAAVAAAHVFSASPTLTINKVPTGATAPGAKIIVYGKIRSSRLFCRANRRVRLFRVRPGPDRLLASDLTDNEGEYRFLRRPRRDQTVYTRIARRVLITYAHEHRCAGDRSSNLFINVRGR